MPVYVDDLLALAAILTTEQLGALMRLRAHAWRSEPPCTLPDSDVRLAVISGLNGTWGANAEALRELLRSDGAGRLIDVTLLCRWNEQVAKHQSAANRGKLGGRPKATEKQPQKLNESSAFRQLSSLSVLVSNNSRTENLEETKQEPKQEAKLNESSALAAEPFREAMNRMAPGIMRPRPKATESDGT